MRAVTKFFIAVGIILATCAAGAAPKKPARPAAKASPSKRTSARLSSHASAKPGKSSSRPRSLSAKSSKSSKKSKTKARAVEPFHPRYMVARPVAPLPVAPESMAPRAATNLSTEPRAAFPAQAPTPQLATPNWQLNAKPSTVSEPEPLQPEGEGAAVPDTPTPYVDSATAESMLAAPLTQPFRNPHALDSFFAALSAEQSARTNGPALPTVRMMQFGDSHTAADIFTGEMRAQLQARFGNGGLGYQYPGHPFAGYKLAGSQRAQTSGWVTQGNRFTQLGDGDTGLGGIAISTSRPGESIFVTTTCETLQVQYLRQPGGGALDFSDNGQPVAEIRTASETTPDGVSTRSAGTFTYTCTPGVHEFQLITMDDAPIRLLGWVTEQAGITYECLGINGAVAPLILRWNPQMFADYLGQRDPQLIVLAYGTNEASLSETRNADYAVQFHRLLQTLHTDAPQASILVLGPYDRALKSGRGRHASWHTSTAIDAMIAVQREACRTGGCAFYDQRARMGGPGAIIRWASQGMAQGDHTHLTGTGYRVLADALFRDLMSAYNSYLQAHPLPSAQASRVN